MFQPELSFAVTMAHTCNNLLVQCMDFRFMMDIRDFLDRESMTGSTDLVSLAGASKNIDDATFLKQIELSKSLHQVSNIVLMNHLDCGAYGGSSAFFAPEEEHAAHVKDLERARDVIKKTYPNVSVWLVIASLDGGKTKFETI